MVLPIQPGERVGQYRVVTCLRSGGMGALYLGRRDGPAGFSRHVAIKVVRPQLADDAAAVAMFLDEARLASRIDHPNVVPVEELGQVGDSYFLVMPYVHGVSVADIARALRQRGERLEVRVAVAVAIAVADGLHAAHEAHDEAGAPLHLVHRDVSPQNVLVSFAGHVKLIDFGIARAAGAGREVRTNTLSGKPRYMAPEQAWCRPVDRRADVYALGVVLWELLAGRPMLVAEDDLTILAMARAPEVAPPGRHAQGVPPALDAAVMGALAVDPAARHATALAFRRALAEAVPDAVGLDAGTLAHLVARLFPGDDARGRVLLEGDATEFDPRGAAPAAREASRSHTATPPTAPRASASPRESTLAPVETHTRARGTSAARRALAASALAALLGATAWLARGRAPEPVRSAPAAPRVGAPAPAASVTVGPVVAPAPAPIALPVAAPAPGPSPAGAVRPARASHARHARPRPARETARPLRRFGAGGVPIITQPLGR